MPQRASNLRKPSHSGLFRASEIIPTLSFRSVWNAFLWPMIVINDYDKLTLTVGLKYLKEWDPNWAVLLAGATISIVPIVIVFLLFQKYFMASAMNSGFGGK